MDLELFLKDVPLFSSIPDVQIRKLGACFTLLTVKKDEVIFAQGDAGDGMYIIESGAVLVSAKQNDSPAYQVELRRGDFFGEMALLAELPRNASAIVALDATLYCLRKDDFTQLLAEHRNIGLFLSRLYARRLSSGAFVGNTPQALPAVKKKLAKMEGVAGIGLDRIRVGVSHLCGSIGIPRETLKQELNLSEPPLIWVEKSDKAVNDLIDTEKRFPIRGARAIARELAGVRIGLALGAGAARGWSHIGVLKVLEEEGIHIDMIAGTSMGALVGALYAAKGDVNHLIHHSFDPFPTRTEARKKIFDYTFPRRGLLQGRKAMQLVADAVDNGDFMDLMIPLYIVGVDIVNGEEILLETGDVARAVRSSLSLPAVFTPFRHNGQWMVDGGLLNPVPVSILEQKGADKIIAVCVENPHAAAQKDSRKPPGILEVIFRTMNIVHGSATRGFAQKADVVIYPSVEDFAWDDFHKGRELMLRGAEACGRMIAEIKK